MVPESLVSYFMINPFAHILSCYHSVIFAGEFPDPFLLISSLLFGVFLSVIGWLIFYRHRHVIPEII
jgi:ABC-type polysaccharide/polyol phosphate export permease